jgi:hydrogenase expression/formation protein HypD
MPLTSFSDPPTAAHLLGAIGSIASHIDNATIMEVCGTHTHEIGRLGLRPLLPRNVRLISGPGCPVCVTPGPVIDAAAGLALRPGTTVCTFGDMIRVPGNTTSLAAARAAGGSVEIVSSPLEALHLAQAAPDWEFVFIAVGFETTIPATVSAVLRADARGTANLSFFIAHRLVPPALRLLCDDQSLGINGFMLPGHEIGRASCRERVLSCG